MVVMIVYMKFVLEQNGKTLHHSGNHKFREVDKDWCELDVEMTEEQMTKGGWKLLEKKVVAITYL